MSSDEAEIRQLVSTWQAATKIGDVNTVLSLMTDDVIFLTPGRPPMDKATFASLARVPEGTLAPDIDITSEIKEIQVAGDLAFLWSHMSVRMSLPGASGTTERTGHTLTVFKKVNGQWLLARDANLLAPTQQSDR